MAKIYKDGKFLKSYRETWFNPKGMTKDGYFIHVPDDDICSNDGNGLLFLNCSLLVVLGCCNPIPNAESDGMFGKLASDTV